MKRKDIKKLVEEALIELIEEINQQQNIQQPVTSKNVPQNIVSPQTHQKQNGQSKISTINSQEKQKQHTSMSGFQYKIFSLKMLINKLNLKQNILDFVKAFKEFDKNVTKNSRDIENIKTYLFLLKGASEALIGNFQSLVIQLEKLEKELENK